jgi:hypothetical protein
MGVDALAEKYVGYNPYVYVANNPINLIDPDGRSINGEYEKNGSGDWVKISNKGDEIGVDFYHYDKTDTKPQETHVTDRKGNWNIINNGRKALSGEVRTNDVSWKTITYEFLSGTGPERSVFEGKHPANYAINVTKQFRTPLTLFKVGSYGKKYATEINWGLLDVVLTRSHNMQAQMMGSYNASFYKIGDKVLSIVQDSKSKTSLYYHIPFTNYSREEGVPIYNPDTMKEIGRTKSETTTYQTYLLLENN